MAGMTYAIILIAYLAGVIVGIAFEKTNAHFRAYRDNTNRFS